MRRSCAPRGAEPRVNFVGSEALDPHCHGLPPLHAGGALRLNVDDELVPHVDGAALLAALAPLPPKPAPLDSCLDLRESPALRRLRRWTIWQLPAHAARSEVLDVDVGNANVDRRRDR